MSETRSPRLSPLWTCPKCRKQYVSRNLWHSCVQVSIEDHFVGRPPPRELFDAFLAAVEELGPVSVAVSKTRIEFMTRVRFAGCQVRKEYLRASFWLKRRAESPRFVRTEFIPPNNWVYLFEIRHETDIDDDIRAFLREARAVGDQEHVVPPAADA